MKEKGGWWRLRRWKGTCETPDVKVDVGDGFRAKP